MQRKITRYFSSTTVSPISTVISLILYQIYADFKKISGFGDIAVLQGNRF